MLKIIKKIFRKKKNKVILKNKNEINKEIL